ncbi:MAG: TetR/AcrR family transcriptional regulator [Sneathiella sp.]
MTSKNEKKPLSQLDWIQAAFRALTEAGPQAIRVEAIARSLKVSKGSFYWHFKDASALRTAMLDHWVEAATADIINTVEDNAPPPANQLRLLVEITTSDLDEPYGGPLAELAIRDWARYDKEAARILARVDRQRLEYGEKLFSRLGQVKETARQNSALLYAALLGLQQLPYSDRVDQRRDLSALLEMQLKS